MLGYLIPDVVERSFVQLVGTLPFIYHAFAFAALCAVLSLLVSRGVRRLSLEVDASLSMRARIGGAVPPFYCRVLGGFGVGQWWGIIAVCALFIVGSLFFAIGRAGGIETDTSIYSLARSVHLCLGPNYGRGDTMSRCEFF